MRIAMPVEFTSPSPANEVAENFARAQTFVICETESEKCEIVKNSAQNTTSGAGVKAAQIIIDQDADAVIARRIGENAFDIFKEAHLPVYKAEYVTVEENLAAFSRETLPLYVSPSPKGYRKRRGRPV